MPIMNGNEAATTMHFQPSHHFSVPLSLCLAGRRVHSTRVDAPNGLFLASAIGPAELRAAELEQKEFADRGSLILENPLGGSRQFGRIIYANAFRVATSPVAGDQLKRGAAEIIRFRFQNKCDRTVTQQSASITYRTERHVNLSVSVGESPALSSPRSLGARPHVCGANRRTFPSPVFALSAAHSFSARSAFSGV